ncbi:type IV pilus modification PilV family protein [Aquabacterium sp.]|uniref:type IV pilus modification PilV family protein n=1 Tax=Aquabacterium sp. TaxID=1872578 RepID=UPI003D6CB07F
MKIARRQTGFMLMEVLISVLVFSVGVIALVSLQAAMTRAQTEAKIRADASYLATELVGLMWSDISNLANYDSANCAGYNTCKMWLSKVNKALPSSATLTPSISVVSAAGASKGDVSITIRWQLPSGDVHKYSMTTTIRGAT